jgi:hypothetical protein
MIWAPSLDSILVFTDESALITGKLNTFDGRFEDGAIPEISDLPLTVVNACMYIQE